MVTPFKMKLKLPGMSEEGKSAVMDVFQQALNEQPSVKIKNVNWAYKTKDLSTRVNHRDTDFQFLVPYAFACKSPPD